VDYDDRLTIATPEGVELSLTLAGVGSRCAAALIDLAIEIVLIVAVTILARSAGNGFGIAIGAIGAFLIVVAYDVLFEVFAGGQTPGKKANGLRVVRSQGQPIEFVSSSIRNVMRVIDFLPTAYLIGISSILATRRNQRLGDLAADSIVVRERKASITPPVWNRPPPLPTAPTGGMLDVSLVTADEVAAIRHYLERRSQLDEPIRRDIAQTMAERLRPKVGGAPDDLRGEPFLVAVVTTKLERPS
jgi:uncharacterized RDD family membrane protein YckC